MPVNEPRPDGLDVGPVRELERDLARAGQLALDREEADADADRHRVAHVAPVSAAPRGDEQPVTDRQDRGGEPRIGEDGRVERTECGGVRVICRNRTRAGHAPTPQHVVGRHERIGRQSRHQRLEIRLVFGLEGIDEGEVEGTGECGLARVRRLRARAP